MANVTVTSSLNGVKDPEQQSPKFPAPESLRRPIFIRPKILMGPGPTNPVPRVTEVLSKPMMGIYSAETYQVKRV